MVKQAEWMREAAEGVLVGRGERGSKGGGASQEQQQRRWRGGGGGSSSGGGSNSGGSSSSSSSSAGGRAAVPGKAVWCGAHHSMLPSQSPRLHHKARGQVPIISYHPSKHVITKQGAGRGFSERCLREDRGGAGVGLQVLPVVPPCSIRQCPPSGTPLCPLLLHPPIFSPYIRTLAGVWVRVHWLAQFCALAATVADHVKGEALQQRQQRQWRREQQRRKSLSRSDSVVGVSTRWFWSVSQPPPPPAPPPTLPLALPPPDPIS